MPTNKTSDRTLQFYANFVKKKKMGQMISIYYSIECF